MKPGIHEALARIAAGDDAPGLADLVAALRTFESRESGSGIAALCHFLDAYPHFRERLRLLVQRLLADSTAAALYAGTGILANTGFFTELNRRIVGRWLPPPVDDSLHGQFSVLFDDDAHAAWLERVPAESWARLYRALSTDPATPDPFRTGWPALLDAVELLSVRIASMGVEPELLRHYRVPRAHGNPFLALAAELSARLDEARSEIPGASLPDWRHARVLAGQCDDALARVRRSARQSGASLALTFLVRRLEQSLDRLREIVALAALREGDAADIAMHAMVFASRLARLEASTHDVADHWRASTALLALLATENASRTGEHYITRTWREYRDMFRSAMGAGAIIGVMALVKLGLGTLHLPPLVEALAFSLNYAIGFVLIYILHFTIATKQPAMTAQTIAGQLAPAPGKAMDSEAIGLFVSRVSRTQVVAIVGNVLLAVPVAAALVLALHLAGGSLPAEKTARLLDDLHPLASPALFHAAIAGLWLFVAGLVSGYVDNLATYERLAARVRRVRWLERLLGAARHARLADWLEENVGGIGGNVFFGFALGLTGFVGLVLGLPLDIRHVTFSAANLAIVAADTPATVTLSALLVAMLGVTLIALVNVATSFALAFTVAARSRDLPDGTGRALLAAVAARLRATPRDFVVPPRNEA